MLLAAVNYLFPNVMLALSWQTVLAYTAIGAITWDVGELLRTVVIEPLIDPNIESSHSRFS